MATDSQNAQNILSIAELCAGGADDVATVRADVGRDAATLQAAITIAIAQVNQLSDLDNLADDIQARLDDIATAAANTCTTEIGMAQTICKRNPRTGEVTC